MLVSVRDPYLAVRHNPGRLVRELALHVAGRVHFIARSDDGMGAAAKNSNAKRCADEKTNGVHRKTHKDWHCRQGKLS